MTLVALVDMEYMEYYVERMLINCSIISHHRQFDHQSVEGC